MQRGSDGKPLAPVGSCRDFFVHVQQEHLEKAQDLLQEALEGQALVCPTQALIEQHFFGSRAPSKTFLERVGDLVILPYPESESVWWHEKHRFGQHFYAVHGGLSRAEMEIPLLFKP